MRRFVAIAISLLVVASAAVTYGSVAAASAVADGRGKHYRVSIDEGATRAEVEADLWQSSKTLQCDAAPTTAKPTLARFCLPRRLPTKAALIFYAPPLTKITQRLAEFRR